MKKKFTIIFFIMIIIFNFICGSISSVRAEDDNDNTTNSAGPLTLENLIPEIQPYGPSNEILKDLRERNMKVKTNDSENSSYKKSNDSSDKETASSAVAISVKVFTFLAEWGNNIPEMVVEATDDSIDIKYFTIYDLVTGEYPIFNMNFYNEKEINENSFEAVIKSGIYKFYKNIRNLSLAFSLFVLVYIGIKIAVSTAASDKSKYKSMLISWLTSIVILFLMQYIITGCSFLNEKSLEIVKNVAEKLDVSDIEEGIFKGEKSNMGTSTGFHMITSFITIAIFVYYQIKFLIAYVYRFCEIAFLIVIGPLVTVMYPLNKSAFSSWSSHLITKYAIQPVHALTYCIFIASAGAIATELPLLAAVFLLSLDKAEKIFANIFGVRDIGLDKIKVSFLDK